VTRTPVVLTINGETYDVEVEARRTLVDVIRDDCGLTGTHVGCEHGVCGACTILVGGEAVRACLMFAVQAEGKDIQTVESLDAHGHMHILQEEFMRHHALQCGFCTPGFLMLAVAALKADPEMDEAMLRDVLSSNLCRCTGYETILQAIVAAQARMRAVA
jgi:carbon-monoxide dehydrogenase small subunit